MSYQLHLSLVPTVEVTYLISHLSMDLPICPPGSGSPFASMASTVMHVASGALLVPEA